MATSREVTGDQQRHRMEVAVHLELCQSRQTLRLNFVDSFTVSQLSPLVLEQVYTLGNDRALSPCERRISHSLERRKRVLHRQ